MGRTGIKIESANEHIRPEAEISFKFDPTEKTNVKLKEKVLSLFAQADILHYEGQNRILDTEKLKQIRLSEPLFENKHIDLKQVLQVLSQIKALPKPADKFSKPSPEKPVVVIPKDLKQLLEPGLNGYAEISQTELVHPWKISGKFQHWTTPVRLASGDRTNFSEMAFLSGLKKLKAKRNEQGALLLWDDEKKDWVNFSGETFLELSGIYPATQKDKGNISLKSQGFSFAQNYMPNLIRQGILKKSDFRIYGNSPTAEIHSVNEKPLNKTAHLNFTNSEGLTAKYYLGRNFVTGTKIPKDGKVKAKLIAPNLVAIIQIKQNGQEEISHVFNLLDTEELKVLRDSTTERLKQRNIEPTKEAVAQNTTVGEKKVKESMRKYTVTEFLLPKPKEDPALYYQRVRPLDNPEFVLNTVQKFFSEAGVGVHNLPWNEQLMLTRILTEGHELKNLKEFTKEYGITGVRTFISLEYNQNLGEKLLNLGENKGLARAVFEKFSEIIDASYTVDEALKKFNISSEDLSLENKIALQNLLFNKASKLLEEYGNLINNPRINELETLTIIKSLEAIKSEIILYAQSFKLFAQEDKTEVDFLLKNTVEKKSSDLNTKEMQEMRAIYSSNRLSFYPAELAKSSVEDFEKTITEPGHNFVLLKDNQDNILAFFHYDQIDTENIYIGSLNLNPSAKDSPVAVIFMREQTKKLGSMYDINAVVWQNNPARLFYTKKLGFVKTEEYADANSGEIFWKILRKKTKPL